jgi:lipopolysaccharide transport system ATP-binding protein
MSDPVIKVENLGKKYVLGHQKEEKYTALRDVISNTVKSILSPNSRSKDPSEEFWALNDVSFEINQGDRVGLIGRNGAGKSTLLKILSRITEPTKGQIKIRGRVASLLEVGTGFHPELTGRENIFLNGAILGMGKAEIKKKFDEIVAFAEVEKFLDTPVKRYSSGMYVRLAFAVAAHLEPEILIVDEVLAVGDAAFQKKCLGKMEEVGNEGRTVIFVSHQMAAIQNLCSHVAWLNHGEIVEINETNLVIENYLNSSKEVITSSLEQRCDRQGNGAIKFTLFSLKNSQGNHINTIYTGQESRIILNYINGESKKLKNVHVSLGIDNHMGQRVAYFSNEVSRGNFEELLSETQSIEIYIPKLALMPGRYYFTIYSTVNGILADWIQNGGFFDVESANYYGTGKLPPKGQGNLLMDYDFRLV